jgi:hypothetical protein
MRRTSSSFSTTISEEFAQLASVAALAVPALGIVIVDPLMSLVDTACIGRTLSTQLAALAPNSSVFNLIFQVRHDSALIRSFIRNFRRTEVVWLLLCSASFVIASRDLIHRAMVCIKIVQKGYTSHTRS